MIKTAEMRNGDLLVRLQLDGILQGPVLQLLAPDYR